MPYSKSSNSNVYYNTFTFDAGELYINIGDLSGVSSVTMYADGELTYTDTGYPNENFSYAATLYGDGETAYIMLDATDADAIATLDYEALFDFRGLDNLIFTHESNREIKDTIIETLLQISPYLEGEIEIDDSVLQVIEAVNDYLGNSYVTTNALSQNIFTVTTTSNGEVSTLNTALLIELYQDAYELPYAEFIDKYDGEGTYQKTCDYFASLGDMTLQELVLSTASDAGLDSETLFKAIDYLVEQITGEEFDIASILNADGTVEGQYEMIQNIANMTVDDFLYEHAGTTTSEMVELLESYKDKTTFEIMFADSSEAEQVYSVIVDLFTLIDDSVDFSFTTYNDGNVKMELAVDQLTFSQEGLNFTANGEVTIETGATIPTYAGDIKTAGSDIYSSLATAVKAVATDGVYVLDDDCYLTVSGSTTKYVNGTKEYTLSANSGLQGLAAVYDKNDDSAILAFADTNGTSDKLVYLNILKNSLKTFYVYGGVVATITYDNDGKVTSIVYREIDYGYDGYEDYYEAYYYTYNSYGWLATEAYDIGSKEEISEETTPDTTYEYEILWQGTLFGYNVYYVEVTETYSSGGSYSYYTYMLDSDILQLLN